MSSLTDLNTAANQTVAFEDDRDPNVIFNVYLEQTQFDFTSTGTEFAVLFPIDVLEIDNVETANVRFRISVPSNYTVDFTGLAPNLSLSQTGTDYTISGITGLSDWLTVKAVTIGIPSDLEGQAAYTASVLWNTLEGPQNYTWNVGIFRPVGLLAAEFDLDSTPGRTRTSGSFPFIVSDLEATLEPFYLVIPVQDIPYGMLTSIGRFTILGINPTISAPFDPVWTLNIEASNSNAIEQIRLLPQHQNPGFSFNSSTKVATIVGNTSTVNTILSNLIVDAAQVEQPFDLIYTLDNDVRPGIGSTRQRFIPISQSFIQPRRFNNTIVDGTAFTADTNLFDGTEVVFQGLDPELNYSLTLSVPSGQGNLRWATNISPLVYSSRNQSITISGTLSFIQARLQGNKIQHRSSNNIFDDLEITVTLNQGPFTLINSALIKVTPRFTVTDVDMNSSSNLISTLNIRHGGFAELNSEFSIRAIPSASADLVATSSMNIFANRFKALSADVQSQFTQTLITGFLRSGESQFVTQTVQETRESLYKNAIVLFFENTTTTDSEIRIRVANFDPNDQFGFNQSRIRLAYGRAVGSASFRVELPGYEFGLSNGNFKLGEMFWPRPQRDLSTNEMLFTLPRTPGPANPGSTGGVSNRAMVVIQKESASQKFDYFEITQNAQHLRTVTDFSRGPARYKFMGASNLTQVPNFIPIEVTSAFDMFRGASSFNQDISSWDVSNITNMLGMFFNASSFNRNISSWDVSNVTRMDGMFRGASSFNRNISSWDVSNVTIMNLMFFDASSFNQNLSNWTTGLTVQPSIFSTGANATFADNANNLKPFLADGVTRINT